MNDSSPGAYWYSDATIELETGKQILSLPNINQILGFIWVILNSLLFPYVEWPDKECKMLPKTFFESIPIFTQFL